MTSLRRTTLKPPRLLPTRRKAPLVESTTYTVLVPLLTNKLLTPINTKLTKRSLEPLSYKQVEGLIKDMFIKLHYRDVLALLRLLEDVELESDEERHAKDQLEMMKRSMELARSSRPVAANQKGPAEYSYRPKE